MREDQGTGWSRTSRPLTATTNPSTPRPSPASRRPPFRTHPQSTEPWQAQSLLTPTPPHPIFAEPYLPANPPTPANPHLLRLPPGQRRPPFLAPHTPRPRLPLPSPASRDAVLAHASAYPTPLRLHSPSAELRALDLIYDRRERRSPVGRPAAARRPGSADTAYCGPSVAGNPMQVVQYTPALGTRASAARSVVIGDSRAAPVAAGGWVVGGAPGVRRIGGTSTIGRELRRAPVVLIDPQLRELQQLARAWTGRPGGRRGD